MADIVSNPHVRTIRELLGMEPDFIPLAADFIKAPPPADLAAVPTTLPIVEPILAPAPQPTVTAPVIVADFEHRPKRFIERDYVRYPLIFLVALGFFYALLNFRAISLQVSSWFERPASTSKEVADDINAAEYSKWIRKYYVYAASPETISLGSDPDKDALTNREEFRLGTNPFRADTDGDGLDDGQEVISNNNPLYFGATKPSASEETAQNINVDIVQSRKDAEEFKRVAGAGSGSQDLPIGVTFAVDPTKPGNVQVPKLGIDVPIIWTSDFSKVQDDLKYGTVHHPDTPYPGERGTSSIHGHSSGDPWDGGFKTAFTKINYLEEGDDVFVTVYGLNGETRRLHYVVRTKQVFEKTDQAQFEQKNGYFLNLSTSWPIGTAFKRYVVTTELVGF